MATQTTRRSLLPPFGRETALRADRLTKTGEQEKIISNQPSEESTYPEGNSVSTSGATPEIHSGGSLRVCGIEGIPEDRYVLQVHAAILWSDHHDRGIETCAVKIFVENHGAALYPAVGTEWILAHSKDPLDMDPAAQEK